MQKNFLNFPGSGLIDMIDYKLYRKILLIFEMHMGISEYLSSKIEALNAKMKNNADFFDAFDLFYINEKFEGRFCFASC